MLVDMFPTGEKGRSVNLGAAAGVEAMCLLPSGPPRVSCKTLKKSVKLKSWGTYTLLPLESPQEARLHKGETVILPGSRVPRIPTRTGRWRNSKMGPELQQRTGGQFNLPGDGTQ